MCKGPEIKTLTHVENNRLIVRLSSENLAHGRRYKLLAEMPLTASQSLNYGHITFTQKKTWK